MKKLLVMGLLSFSATAFSQTCEVDMVDRNAHVVRTFRAFGEPASCVEGMKQCRKSIRFDYQNSSLDCVQAGRNQPLPPTGPLSVTGIAEDNSFTITGRDASELHANCLSDIRREIYGSADELFFTANNGRFVSTSSSSWYSDAQICSILEQEAIRAVSPTYTTQIRVVGSLEREPFQILANDRAELLSSCISAFAATRQGNTDELTFSLNGAPFQRVTTSGWWNTPARACKALIQNLDSQLR